MTPREHLAAIEDRVHNHGWPQDAKVDALWCIGQLRVAWADADKAAAALFIADPAGKELARSRHNEAVQLREAM